MNYTLYADIIGQIHRQDIRDFTTACLKDAPEELETIPATVSGKYHPEDARREGGLVWHTQRACWFAWQFIQGYQWDKDDIRGDIVICAMILHDIGKKGHYAKYFDYIDHPKTAAKMIEKHKDMLPEKVFKLIQGCVMHHMGPFGGKFWKKDISKYNMLELTVYNADYLASKSYLDIKKE